MNLQPERTLHGIEACVSMEDPAMDPNQNLVMLDLVCCLDAGLPLNEDYERFVEAMMRQSKKPREEVVELFIETMRSQLAEQKGCRPEQVVFWRDPDGKPGWAIMDM